MQLYSVINSCRDALQMTLESYCVGRAKTIDISSVKSDDSADKYLSDLINTRLPSTDRLLIDKFSTARQRGLLACRRGDLTAAEKAFSAANVLLQLDKLSHEGMLLYKSFLEQAEAYLDYRLGDFTQARNRTYSALETNMILEEEYGYEIIFFGRIQLVHNLVRIDAGCMQWSRAIKLAFQILGYLEGVLDILPVPGLWGYERVKRQIPEFVAAMFAQVTGEIAIILASQDHQFDSDLLKLVNTNENNHCHPQAYAWLLLKLAFINNEVATFLAQASNFVAQGRGDTPLLWYATLADLVTLCDEIKLPESDLLKQEIIKDVAAWNGVPKKLLSLFS
ncbi:hypothetical protein [Nostoc parmelioides]|uniref:Uncharacterized protein n=1 Tax=Nostoc parmelioides FACHB-3921 TaxID=2692909 RepID=A0ABR8B9J2_9NOSO|nr:hypothetical protein [Nostoc parmelioides]MBD2250501.1 hypothetical protein [Nostoc parmelioides FACHB-3921]